ncbi:MAG: hypothetical protein GY822_03525 [Deltaproteobacteria bacterium]|nr:hypothetical protein [Deltaproteobacteria bacterium]
MSHPTHLQILSENALRSLRPPAFLKSLYAHTRENRNIRRWQGALIRCSCFEDGKCSAPPFPRAWLATDNEGWLLLKSPHHEDAQKQRAFQDWMKNACVHPEMNLESTFVTPLSTLALEVFLEEVSSLEKSSAPEGPRDAHQMKVALAARNIAKMLQKVTIAASEVGDFKKQIVFLLGESESRQKRADWGYVASLGRRPIGYFSAQRTVLFQSGTHEIGVCELGIFVKERRQRGKVLQLSPRLELHLEPIDSKLVFKNTAFENLFEESFSSEVPYFSLAFTPRIALDESTIWRLATSANLLWNKTVEGEKYTVLKAVKSDCLDVARPALLALLKLASTAERSRQPLIGVF